MITDRGQSLSDCTDSRKITIYVQTILGFGKFSVDKGKIIPSFFREVNVLAGIAVNRIL